MYILEEDGPDAAIVSLEAAARTQILDLIGPGPRLTLIRLELGYVHFLPGGRTRRNETSLQPDSTSGGCADGLFTFTVREAES